MSDSFDSEYNEEVRIRLTITDEVHPVTGVANGFKCDLTGLPVAVNRC